MYTLFTYRIAWSVLLIHGAFHAHLMILLTEWVTGIGRVSACLLCLRELSCDVFGFDSVSVCCAALLAFCRVSKDGIVHSADYCDNGSMMYCPFSDNLLHSFVIGKNIGLWT